MSGLEPYLEAARSQRPPPRSSDSGVSKIIAGAAAARRRRRAQTVAGATALLSVCAALWWTRQTPPATAPAHDVVSSGHLEPLREGPQERGEAVTQARQADGPEADGVVDGARPWTRIGPDVLATAGRYEVRRTGSSVTTPAGALWLDGEASVEIDDQTVAVSLRFGVAAFDDGRGLVVLESREVFRAERSAEDESLDSGEDAVESATSLARRAESQLLAGKRRAARATLSRLVRLHPKSPEAKTAVLDIATISRRMGEEAQAACALGLYIEAWPSDARVRSAQAQLERLPATRCRGLEPR